MLGAGTGIALRTKSMKRRGLDYDTRNEVGRQADIQSNSGTGSYCDCFSAPDLQRLQTYQSNGLQRTQHTSPNTEEEADRGDTDLSNPAAACAE